VLQGVRSSVVGAEFRIEVAKDSNANGITHGSIVLDEQLVSDTRSRSGA
jgi:hypothetical protein